MTGKTAKKIVKEIIADMRGRSGGDHWFESCDEDIQDEIRETWEKIVYAEANKASA